MTSLAALATLAALPALATLAALATSTISHLARAALPASAARLTGSSLSAVAGLSHFGLLSVAAGLSLFPRALALTLRLGLPPLPGTSLRVVALSLLTASTLTGGRALAGPRRGG